MIASRYPRRGALYSANSLPPYAKPHRIISFADAHPLSPLESYLFENMGEGRTLLHSSKTQLSSFQAIPHSASKNRAAWDTSRNSPRGSKMNQASTKTCSSDDTLCHLHRQPTNSGASLGPRLASHPCRFLVNYSHPMSQMAGLGSYIPLFTRGPRSQV